MVLSYVQSRISAQSVTRSAISAGTITGDDMCSGLGTMQ